MSDENMKRAQEWYEHITQSMCDADIEDMARLLDEAERRGAEREREACARVCEEQSCSFAYQECARRIRARGTGR